MNESDLFTESSALQRPLAERMRPRSLDEFVGQQKLLGPGTALRRALQAGQVHSMILWGPPGCGKTSLALMLADLVQARFVSLSAVLCGLPDVRKAMAEAEAARASGERTVLFLDEVHRFNKVQQDAFLPHIERGTVLFVGATTENPSFALNSALLSRCRVHVLAALEQGDIEMALQRAVDSPLGLGDLELTVEASALSRIAEAADGDVRRALSVLEIAVGLAEDAQITEADVLPLLDGATRRFDKQGDQHYDLISALHKSIRSSNPDAALYWLARILDGGGDPAFLARRLVRMASEDIGNADPRALELSVAAWQAYERMGSPEGDLALAQVAVFLACAAKSNAVYTAFKAAQADVVSHGSAEVPLHLRNAPTKLMKSLGYGKAYVYDHDQPDGIAYQQTGFPDSMGERLYYQPVDRGLEQRIAEKLSAIRARRKQ